MILPYTHEPSWFAALLYTSGMPDGMIMRDEFTPSGEAYSWVYCDGACERVGNLPDFIENLVSIVAENGYLFISLLERHARMVKEAITGLTLLEESYIDERVFLAYKRGDAPVNFGVPEVLIYRGGGAIGDVYHAAAVAEEYAKRGFKVCFMAQQVVHHVFQNNPHITWFVPEPTMPNQQLFRFLTFWEKRVRLLVVLDYSIEGFLLKQPFNTEYFWSKAQRERMCGKSYAVNVADMAGLQKVAVINHYGSQQDKAAVSELTSYLHKETDGDMIFIQLGGSSDVHKWNPHIPQLCVMLLGRTDYSIYLSFSNAHAGMAHKIKKYVEANYGETQRLVLSIPKRSFSTQVEIAKRAACVLGPETGLMVGLSHHEVRKVLLVSHSAPSNFSDWLNTKLLTGDVPCQPCHRQHADFTFCNKDTATGAAACQAAITTKEMFEALGKIGKYAPQFLVVAPQEDAQRIADNIGVKCIPVEPMDTPDSLREKLEAEGPE